MCIRDSDGSSGGYRSATPNTRGQYSDAVLSELESQNEDQLAGMMGRVRMLKDVSAFRVFDCMRGDSI